MKLTALKAAQKMMSERGYVVIGFPGEERMGGRPGDLVSTFAGQSIFPFYLRGERETDREDWELQAEAIFGDRAPARSGPNAESNGEKFWRCTLTMELGAN